MEPLNISLWKHFINYNIYIVFATGRISTLCQVRFLCLFDFTSKVKQTYEADLTKCEEILADMNTVECQWFYGNQRCKVMCKKKYQTLTWILCKDSREDSSQSHLGSNFIFLFFLKCKLEPFRPNFMNLVPGVFEIRYILFM